MIMAIDKKTLDRTDIKILDILQRNGKISNVGYFRHDLKL